MSLSQFAPTGALTDAGARFAHARAVYEMAVADMYGASGEMDSASILHLYCDAAADAGFMMMMTPAPDMAALVYKLETFHKGDYASFDDANEIVGTLIEDARRLAQDAPTA